MLLNSPWQFGNNLSLSRNDRISSFNWISRGSKHCFLTSFFKPYCYFLFLLLLRNCYLLVSLHLSQLHGNLVFHPVSYTIGSPSTMSYMHPNISGTHEVFSWSKMLVGTWYKNKYLLPIPSFAEGFTCKHPLGAHESFLFFSHNVPHTDIFLAWHKPTFS
jgi:hypothetical protein